MSSNDSSSEEDQERLQDTVNPSTDTDNDDSDDNEPSSKRVIESDSEEETLISKPVKKQKTIPSSTSSTLFIGNVAYNLTEDTIKDQFEDWLEEVGCVDSVRIISDPITKKKKGIILPFSYLGYAYVQFNGPHAKIAMKFAGRDLGGRPIRVDISEPKIVRDKSGANRKEEPRSTVSDTLFLANLPFGDEDDLRVKLQRLFKKYGSVLNVRLPADRESGKMKGFGYISMENVDAAKRSMEAVNGTIFEGRCMRIDYAAGKSNSSSRRGRRKE